MMLIPAKEMDISQWCQQDGIDQLVKYFRFNMTIPFIIDVLSAIQFISAKHFPN